MRDGWRREKRGTLRRRKHSRHVTIRDVFIVVLLCRSATLFEGHIARVVEIMVVLKSREIGLCRFIFLDDCAISLTLIMRRPIRSQGPDESDEGKT